MIFLFLVYIFVRVYSFLVCECDMIRMMLFLFVFAGCIPADVNGEEMPGQNIPAVVTKVVDGDTIKVSAHIWPSVKVDTMVRIRGIDTPELRGNCPLEKELAKKAKKFVEDNLAVGSVVYLTDVEHDKYGGRAVAKVTDENKVDVGDALIKNGLARPYSGKVAKSDWCTI